MTSAMLNRLTHNLRNHADPPELALQGKDDAPVAIEVKIMVQGDRLFVDFAGTSPQFRAAINSTISLARSAVYASFRNVVGGNPPNNEGFFRPIEVVAPKGCLVNPIFPAAVAARGLTGFRVANTLFGAVKRDLFEGKITAEFARREFGVQEACAQTSE
jgi:N-methylhydantoinase B/oxoprolinase/acetone carboxylase alpha subunit